MSTILTILASSQVEGIQIKDVMLVLFALLVIGAAAWGVKTWAIPSPFCWLIYFVLGAVAVVITWKFLQGL
jgi:hypothetical protein